MKLLNQVILIQVYLNQRNHTCMVSSMRNFDLDLNDYKTIDILTVLTNTISIFVSAQ